MTVRRTLTAVLAAGALVAPAAQAQPADMHGSVAQAAAQALAHAQHKQDLRSPDARDAGTPRASRHVPVSQLPAGQPVWPAHPAALVAPAQQPATGGDGSPVIPIAAGALVALGLALTARRVTHHGSRRARIAA